VTAPQAPTQRTVDPGLQTQRTVLAWSRTALALTINALLALRVAWLGGHSGIAAIAIVLLVAAAATQAYGRSRRRALLAMGVLGAPPAAATACVCAVALLACALGGASNIVLALRVP
jgi:uncharacterized membrane protein YidH (DUF202 family)